MARPDELIAGKHYFLVPSHCFPEPTRRRHSALSVIGKLGYPRETRRHAGAACALPALYTSNRRG